MDLCNINDIKALLARHGFHFSKAKGQNFLTQSWVPQNIVLEAGIDGTCGVLEVGPGIGPLTAELAKRALLRPAGSPNPDPFYAEMEQELLERINALGIGPQGSGGRTTCLGLSIETAPTHVAGLPVAVNVSCHVTRRAAAEL